MKDRLMDNGRMVRERVRIEQRYGMSARELFARLRPLVLAARPVIEEGTADRMPRYGRSTFRNRIDEKGQLA